MWKKRLIATVTFITGLYFFLEYIVPPIVPFRKVSGKVVSVPSKSQVIIDTGRGRRQTVTLKDNYLVLRELEGGGKESIELTDVPAKVKPGDKVEIGPTTYLSGWMTAVNDFLMVMLAFAWGMALLSLWLVHWGNIKKRRPEWSISVILFGAVAVGMYAGWGYKQAAGTNGKIFADFLFNGVQSPGGATIFSLTTFYMASSAYRSFKAKTTEAIVMMVSALIVMLGQIPMGLWMTGWLPEPLQIPSISQWLLYSPSSAAIKGMWFGMMLAAMAVGLRFWLSLERGAFFDREL